MDTEIDFANYYAVELLTSLFGKIDPTELDIMSLEEALKHKNCRVYLYMRKHISCRRALIISPDTIELNTLKIMLSAQGFTVDIADSRDSFLNCVKFKKRYEVVIVSDKFTEIGLNFFKYYFHNAMRKRQPYLIYLAESNIDIKTIGFNAYLKRPFFTKDLTALLPKYSSSKKRK